ncbi:MAG: hypothetical protein L3J50_08605 [Emcibacter sp.]|nr:hypothetical protein [Emcibacter sp.]
MKKNKSLTSDDYDEAMAYEYAGLINALGYLCQEATQAKLELVCLHLNIAIDELKEYRRPEAKAS